MTRSASPPSLRRVLLGWLLLPLIGLVPLTAALLYALAVRPALDGLDRALTDTAVALAQIIVVRDGRPALPLSEQTARALHANLVDQTLFAVGDPAGGLLGGDAALRLQMPALRAGEWRFFDTAVQGRTMRAAAFGAACGDAPPQVCTILVAESLGKRAAAEWAVLLASLAAATALALSLALLALLAVRRGLRPLRRAAAEVRSRTLDRLQPVDARAVPKEAASFVEALNDLFARLHDAATAQRAFVADAAHQLRTPLATLRSDAAQALAAPHPAELHPTLERLHAAAERGTRLTQQLLALARAEGAALDPAQPPRPLDLRQLAGEAADQWLQPSLAAQQDLGFDLAPAWISGRALLLHELLGNLIHNAIEHAGAGARVTVRTALHEGRAWLEVEDDGPGVADDEREPLWERFRRGRHAAGGGSGLGLAIVRDIARLHGAQVALQAGDGGRGLRVRIAFPALPPASPF
jgi:two-component system sensor histidine kinase TctE